MSKITIKKLLAKVQLLKDPDSWSVIDGLVDERLAREKENKRYSRLTQHEKDLEAFQRILNYFAAHDDGDGYPIDINDDVYRMVEIGFYTIVSESSDFPWNIGYLKLTRRGEDMLKEMNKKKDRY